MPVLISLIKQDSFNYDIEKYVIPIETTFEVFLFLKQYPKEINFTINKDQNWNTQHLERYLNNAGIVFTHLDTFTKASAELQELYMKSLYIDSMVRLFADARQYFHKIR